MTTYARSYYVNHSTDLEFNQWVDVFTTGLTNVGLVQTADTGQSTFLGSPLVPRAGTNSDAGYHVYRADMTHVGSPQIPLYIKFRFGTYSVSTYPRILVDIGTGTDGAGNVTGTTITGASITYNGTRSGGTSGPCYFCHTDGFLGIAFGFKNCSSSYPAMALFHMFLTRGAQADGQPTGDFFTLSGVGGQASYLGSREQRKGHYSVNLNTGTVYGSMADSTSGQSQFHLPTGGPSFSSYVNETGDTAVFPAWSAAPQPYPLPSLVAGWSNDLPTYSTFIATPMGTTPHTYIAFDNRMAGSYGYIDAAEAGVGNAAPAPCMLWE